MYDNTRNTSLIFLPVALQKSLAAISCPQCGTKYPISAEILEKKPIRPIQGDGGSWRPLAVRRPCGNCGHGIDLRLPIIKPKYGIDVYSDESKSSSSEHLVLAACGIVPASRSDLIDEVSNLKRKLFGRDDVLVHMRALWNGSQRRKVYGLGTNRFDDVKEFIDGWCHVFASYANQEKATQYVASYSKDELKTISRALGASSASHHLWSNGFVHFCWLIIYNLTRCGITPRIYFEEAVLDKVRVEGQNRTRTVWLKECFEAESRRFIYPYITHGHTIETPREVKKGADVALEHADVIAYFAQKALRGNTDEKKFFDLAKLEPIHQMRFAPPGGSHVTIDKSAHSRRK